MSNTPVTPNPADVGMATGPAPIPAAPSAIQPNPAAQPTAQPSDNSNAPDAQTPAAKSIPANLVNNPAVPSQKLAAQADANKNSPAPDHKWLHDAAVEMAGGARYTTTYAPDGTAIRTEVPVSPAHLGLAIALEVLRGGLAGGNAKDTVAAAQQGAASVEKQRAAVKQANIDQDAQAKADQNHKLAVVKNNLETHQLALNVGKQDLDMNNAFVDSYKDTANMIEKHPDMIKADVPEDQIQAGLKNGTYNVTKDMFIPHGDPVAVMDPQTGKQKEVNGVPVWGHNYYVVDGAAKGQLTQEIQDMGYKIGKFRNPDGSRVAVPTNSQYPMATIGRYATEFAQVQTAEEQIERHKDEVLGDKKGPRVSMADSVASDPTMMDAVKDYSRFIGTGAPDQVLGAMMAAGKGASAAKLMDFMGVTPDDIRDAENQRLAEHTAATAKPTAEKESEEAARFTLGKAGVDPNKPVTNGMQGTHKLTADEQTAYNVLNGVQTGKEKLKTKELQDTRAITDSDLDMAAANLVRNPSDTTALKSITSLKGDERLRLYNKIKALNPNYDTGKIDAKVKVLNDFADGKASDNIVAYNTFLGHALDASEAINQFRGTGGNVSPLINKSLNWLDKNAFNDPTYAAFKTALIPVQKEFMSFLNNNRAEHEADIEDMKTVIDPTSTPALIQATLKKLAQSGDIRLTQLGRKYQKTMGVPYKGDDGEGIYTPEGKAAIMRLTIPHGMTRIQQPSGAYQDVPSANAAAVIKQHPQLKIVGQEQ